MGLFMSKVGTHKSSLLNYIIARVYCMFLGKQICCLLTGGI